MASRNQGPIEPPVFVVTELAAQSGVSYPDPVDLLVIGAAVVGACLLALGVVLAAEFPDADDPDRARALFGVWFAGLVGSLGVAAFDRVHVPVQTDFPHVLAVLAALVVASGVAVGAELR